MKFGQFNSKGNSFVKKSGEIVLLKNYAENKTGRLVSDLFLFFEKAF